MTLYKTEARRLGTEIAARGLRLVYGGSDAGLMGIMARAVLEGGGKAAGIIPRGPFMRKCPLWKGWIRWLWMICTAAR